MRLLGRKLTLEQLRLLADGTKVYVDEGKYFESGVSVKQDGKIIDKNKRFYNLDSADSIESGEVKIYETVETDEMELITLEQASELKDGTVVFADDTDCYFTGCYVKKGNRLVNPYGTNGYLLGDRGNTYIGRKVNLYISKIEKREIEKGEIEMGFKVGDKVKALVTVGGNYVENATGVVVEVDYDEEQCYLVNFNEEINGHHEDNRCWWMDEDGIELIKEVQKVSYETPLKTIVCAEKYGFKIGDRIKVKEEGKLIGEVGTVIDFWGDSVGVAFDERVGIHSCNLGANGNSCECGYGQWLKPHKIELISGVRGLRATTPIFDEPVVNDVEITIKGRKITASYKGFVGVARCNPDDDFNESYGIGLALERLGAEIKVQGEKEIKEAEKSKIPTLDFNSYKEFLDGKVGVKFESFDDMKEFLKKLDGVVGLKWNDGQAPSDYVPYKPKNLIYIHKGYKALLNDREEYCKEKFDLKVVKYK